MLHNCTSIERGTEGEQMKKPREREREGKMDRFKKKTNKLVSFQSYPMFHCKAQGFILKRKEVPQLRWKKWKGSLIDLNNNCALLSDLGNLKISQKLN